MRILLSAYACEPNKGSETGVGRSWANELVKTMMYGYLHETIIRKL